MVVAVFGAAAVIGATVSGCSFNVSVGGKPTVAKEDLQKDITDRLSKGGNTPESVTCKDNLEGEVGKSTRCEVVMSESNTFDLVVVATKVDDKTVNYDMTPALSSKQLEKAVANLVVQNSGEPADMVSCASGLDGKVGATAHCQVTAQGKTIPHTVRVTEVNGLMMNFHVSPD
jgi:Domain of unknown function (DUF4333)